MEKVGIIGFGNMGRAIAQRIKDKYAVSIFDKDKNKISVLNNIAVCSTLLELVKQSEIIILAIKPQDFKSLFNEIKSYVGDKLIITIAAGITTRYIKHCSSDKIRIIRVMPNMAAQIGMSVSVVFKDNNATEKDLDLARKLLSCIGVVLVVQEEKMMNAATAVSGSGPAFFCHHIKDNKNVDQERDEFIKMLAEAAVSVGFDYLKANVLSEKTVDGVIAMLKEKNLTCAQIIKMVSSKGGTTLAGLKVLDAGGTLKDAVKSASRRAEELGEKD